MLEQIMRSRRSSRFAWSIGAMLAAAIGLMAACQNSGTGPSSVGSRPTAITVSSSSDLMLIGTTETFTAMASYADGTSAPLQAPTWGSDDPAVAKVSGTGLVEAVGAGSTSIHAESSGVRGSKPIRSVPRYEGSWQGCWRHLTCTSVPPGGFDWCNGITIGDRSGLTLILTQDRDRTQGTLNLSGVVMNVTGSIATGGALSLAGNRPNSSDSVSNWMSAISGSNLEGTFTWSNVPAPPSTQTGRVLTDSLFNVVRVDTLASPVELALKCR